MVTLSTQNNAKLLTQLKSCFKRAVSWNKYPSKPELLVQNPSLSWTIFQDVNRLFVLSFQNDVQRMSNKIYLPNVKIKDYNVMIDGKTFLINQ